MAVGSQPAGDFADNRLHRFRSAGLSLTGRSLDEVDSEFRDNGQCLAQVAVVRHYLQVALRISNRGRSGYERRPRIYCPLLVAFGECDRSSHYGHVLVAWSQLGGERILAGCRSEVLAVKVKVRQLEMRLCI